MISQLRLKLCVMWCRPSGSEAVLPFFMPTAGLVLLSWLLPVSAYAGWQDLQQPPREPEQAVAADTVPAADLPVIRVIAIEYPPYTSQYLPGSGSAFRGLRYQLEQASLNRAGRPEQADEAATTFEAGQRETDGLLRPYFLPPARADYLIKSGRWSASFYPPKADMPHYIYFPYGRKPVDLGLFRRTSERPWPQQLEGLQGRVAIGRRWGDRDGEDMTGPLARKLRATNLDPVPVDSLYQAFMLLSYGRVDYVFAEKVAGYYIQRFVGESAGWAEFSPEPLQREPLGVWLNLADPGGALLHKVLLEWAPGSPR